MPADKAGKERLPESKKEEQDTLAKVVLLAPLLTLVLQLLELILKMFGVIN